MYISPSENRPTASFNTSQPFILNFSSSKRILDFHFSLIFLSGTFDTYSLESTSERWQFFDSGIMPFVLFLLSPLSPLSHHYHHFRGSVYPRPQLHLRWIQKNRNKREIRRRIRQLFHICSLVSKWHGKRGRRGEVCRLVYLGCEKGMRPISIFNR